MSLTLDGTLQTAQNGSVHHPIVEILSNSWLSDIPFDGQYLTTSTTNETQPQQIILSSGRLAIIYKYSTNYIHYIYTNIDRTEFSSAISFYTYYVISDMSLCELSNGNIGILYRYNTGTNYDFRYKIITPTGSQVSDGSIFSHSISMYTSGPFVIKLSDDSYIMFYSMFDSPDYYIHKRTSSDFTSWSAASHCSIGGGLDTTHRWGNPSALQITTDDLLLFFEYVQDTSEDDQEKCNIYMSISSDLGSTWGDASQVTNYTTYNMQAYHPMAAQKQANEVYLAFTEHRASLLMNSTVDPLWCSSWNVLYDLHFDAATRMLYGYVGFSYDRGAFVKINVDTWEIDTCWDNATTPALNDCWYPGWGYDNTIAKGNGQYACVVENATMQISVVNGNDNWIKHYSFAAYSGACGTFSQNITGFTPQYTPEAVIEFVQIDASTNRMWVIIRSQTSAVWPPMCLHIGWVDLTASEPYTYNEVSRMLGFEAYQESLGATKWILAIDNDLVFAAGVQSGGAYYGGMLVLQLSTGAIAYWFNFEDISSFHKNGIEVFDYDAVNNFIYAGFAYSSDTGMEDKRGLMIVDINNQVCSYERPSWASYNDYQFNDICINSAGIVWISSAYGITSFNPTDKTWTLYSNDTFPGLTADGYDSFTGIVYDDAADFVYAIKYGDGTELGIRAFSPDGYLNLSKYTVGNYTTSWSWGSIAELVEGYIDYDSSISFDPDDQGLYAFWINQEGTEYSIKWDKEVADFPLSDYLVRGEELSIRRTIDGSPAEVNFVISHGYLFDPHNINSLRSIIVEKGRKITIRMGESVAGSDYWQAMGEFAIKEVAFSYKRLDYPVMKVKAVDKSDIWAETEIPATISYSHYPENVIEDVVTDFSDFELADISLGTFSDRIELYHQWVDTSLLDIVLQVCHRFRYYPRIDINGNLTAKFIDDGNAVDHTYSDTTSLIEFTPDDTFSDYINKITVIGQERTFMEVLYNEERLGYINGTVGWWGYRNNFDVYFSEDKQKQAVNIRLVKDESANSISAPLRLAGGIQEYISYEDPNHHYCTVTVKAANLVPELIALIFLKVIVEATTTDAPSGGDPHTHFRIGTFINMIDTMAICAILGAVANFQYQLYGRPVGHMRRSVEAVWNDYDMQNQLNMIVPKKYEDPMCYTVDQCQLIADFDGLITQLQRKRVKFSKVTHLQDEDGDTISLKHPYTNIAMSIFITDITRRLKIPDSPNGDGYWIDDIEGWVL